MSTIDDGDGVCCGDGVSQTNMAAGMLLELRLKEE